MDIWIYTYCTRLNNPRVFLPLSILAEAFKMKQVTCLVNLFHL